MLRFERPEFLWLMLLALPMAWAAVRWMRSMNVWRRSVSVVLRVIVLMLITAVLAGATLVKESRRIAVLALVDTSGSIRRFYSGIEQSTGKVSEPRAAKVAGVGAIEAVRNYLRRASESDTQEDHRDRRGPDDAMGIIVFDGRAVAIATPMRADVLDRALDVPMTEGTDIAQAVRLATASFPPDAAVRVVLFSDGVETTGSVLEAAREAANVTASHEGVAGTALPIDVVPLTYRVESEVSVKSLDVPSHAAPGSTVSVRITLEATEPSRGVLRLLQEGTELDLNGGADGRGLKIDVPKGESVHVVSATLSATRLNRFEAIFEPSETNDGAAGDTVSENNRATGFTLTPGAGSVLLISSGGADPGPLAGVLESAGMSVHRADPAGLPEDLLAMQAYDEVILQNVAADDVPIESHAALAAYVEDFGGGLVMIGGPSSLGAGGWKGTAIEPILPVKLDLPEKLLSPAAAVMIVMDCSSSMGWSVLGSSKSQMQIACEGAAMAIESMDKTDLVGVIAFNEEFRVVSPLSPNSHAAQTAAMVRALGAQGGTNLPPALQEAGRILAGAKADVKHVIVLSDGVSMGTEALPAIAAELHEQGISVSTIAVGDDADIGTMATMAGKGGGVYYPVNDPNTLPRVFVKAVRVVREPLVRRQPFTPARVRGVVSPLLQGMSDSGPVPKLHGLVLTQARTEPTVTTALVTNRDGGAENEPVLAHWQAGLGRVVVFTSDASEWARDWLDWPGYSALWTNTARWVGRPDETGSGGASRGELRVERESRTDDGRINVEYVAGETDTAGGLSVSGNVFTPHGTRTPIRLVQTGVGRYSASVPASTSGDYIVTVTPNRTAAEKNAPMMPLIGGVSVQQGEEYRAMRDNRELLERLAHESGGRVLDIGHPEDAALFDRAGVRPSISRQSLWGLLLPLALGVLLFDVGSRKIAWDRWFQAEFKAALRRERAESIAARGRGATHTAGRLRSRDRQVGEMLDTPVAAEPTQNESGANWSGRLSTEDARRIVVEQRRRRAAAERAAVNPPKPAHAEEPRTNADADKADNQQGGLFAAKRRARERMEREQREQGDDR